ncbi:MAG: EAL domain-containing protein, partial [Alphaproteobacteria bacterium]|nr:EAL domain-containing protein [Alphaproteobacteria bacterium]
QRKVRYYESFSRIRDAAGHVLAPEQYLAAAGASGALPAIDNLLLFRCVQLVRRLRRRQPHVGFFINLGRATIEDREFVDQFAEFLGQNADLAGNIFFEIAQSDLEQLGVEGEDALERLGQLGCRFSLDNVTSLAIDLAALGRRHFRFIKLDAGALLAEVYQSDGQIDVLDLKELLRRHKIDLIAEKIETEQQVVDLLDYEVDFGQGFLFGEPRRSRDEV